MTYTSDEPKEEKDFLSDYLASNPELYMGDMIRERVAGPGERALVGKESDDILNKVRTGVIKV